MVGFATVGVGLAGFTTRELVLIAQVYNLWTSQCTSFRPTTLPIKALFSTACPQTPSVFFPSIERENVHVENVSI